MTKWLGERGGWEMCVVVGGIHVQVVCTCGEVLGADL